MQRHHNSKMSKALPAVPGTAVAAPSAVVSVGRSSSASSLPCVDMLSLGTPSVGGSERAGAPTDRSSASAQPVHDAAGGGSAPPSGRRAAAGATAATAAAVATGATGDVGSSASSFPLAPSDAALAPHPLRAFMHRTREEVVAHFVARSADTADSGGGVGGTKAVLADALAAYVAAIPPGGLIPPVAEDRPWRMKRRRLAASLTAIEKKELRALRNRERSMLLRTAAKRRLLALQAAAAGLVDDNVGLENMLAVLLAVDTGAKLRARQHIGRRGLAQLQYVLV